MRVKYRLSCTMACIIVASSVFTDTRGSASHENLEPLFEKTITKTKKTVDFNALKPRVVEAFKIDNGVRYIFSNGEILDRIGGSIAWRNNNPGCIRYYRDNGNGAIGSANRFAIFPDEETGMRAIKLLLLSSSYRNLTIRNAICIYAPPHENDTERYINSLCARVGVQSSTRICDLNDEQLNCVVNTIRTLEGWIVGKEIFTPATQNNEHTDNLSTLKNRLNECTICWFFNRTI